MELTPEEVLAQLKVRGFETSFQRTPLRDFWGTLESIGGSMVDRFQPPRMEVLYNFADMEVIQSTEPYISPVAQITIMHSNRVQSAMGVFGKSIDKLINAELPDDAPPEDAKGQDYLIGKRLHMVMTGGHMMWDGQTKAEVARECWEVTEIEGEAASEPAPTVAKKAPAKAAPAKVAAKPATKGTSPAKRALELLNGKTEQAFYQAVFADSVVKADGALVSQIIARNFIQPLIDSEQVTLDEDGIHHVG